MLGLEQSVTDAHAES